MASGLRDPEIPLWMVYDGFSLNDHFYHSLSERNLVSAKSQDLREEVFCDNQGLFPSEILVFLQQDLPGSRKHRAGIPSFRSLSVRDQTINTTVPLSIETI